MDEDILNYKKAQLRGKSDAESDAVLALMETWYRLDTNVYPSRFILMSLASLNDREYWDRVFPVLSAVLSGLYFDEEDKSLVVGRSITEWEFRHAYQGPEDRQRCFWAHRMLQDEHTIEDGDYYDCVGDGAARSLLLDLRRDMEVAFADSVTSSSQGVYLASGDGEGDDDDYVGLHKEVTTSMGTTSSCSSSSSHTTSVSSSSRVVGAGIDTVLPVPCYAHTSIAVGDVKNRDCAAFETYYAGFRANITDMFGGHMDNLSRQVHKTTTKPCNVKAYISLTPPSLPHSPTPRICEG